MFVSPLEFLTNELEKSSIEPRPAGNIEAPDPQELIDLEVRKGEERGRGRGGDMSIAANIFFACCVLKFNFSLSPQSKFEVLEAEVKEINANKETLKRNLLDLIELQQILIKAQIFFQEVLNHTHARTKIKL